MTEPFRVPEPSDAACLAAHEELLAISATRFAPGAGKMLRAAYAVDFQPFARAEAERALDHMRSVAPVTDSLRHIKDAYLIDRFSLCPDCMAEQHPGKCRFPEAAPDGSTMPVTDGPFGRTGVTPQPSAEPQKPPCTHQVYTVNWAGSFQGPVTCQCGLKGVAYRTRPSHDADYRIDWVTPSAGERCQRPHFGVPGTCELPKGHSGRCVIPTPTEGERKPGIAELSKPPFVPTPSAGEEDAFVTEFPCTQCGHTFRTAEGYTTHNCPPVGVSAGETKATWENAPERHRERVGAVGARPEGHPSQLWRTVEQLVDLKVAESRITPAERDFLRAQATLLLTKVRVCQCDEDSECYEGQLYAAARKVLSLKDSE